MKKLLPYLSITIFVLPLSVFCNDQNIDAKIQELKSAQYKKMHELSKLGKKIAKKNDLLRSIANRGNLEISHLDMDKNEQEIEAIKSSMNNFGEALLEAIKKKKNVKQFFEKELFKNKKNLLEFDALKLMIMRSILECDFLKLIVERYEECQQELIEINQKLSDLNK